MDIITKKKKTILKKEIFFFFCINNEGQVVNFRTNPSKNGCFTWTEGILWKGNLFLERRDG